MTEILVEGPDFPEGPRWHDGALWFSDQLGGTVYRVDLDGRHEPVVDVPGGPSGLGWLPDGDLLVVSMEDRKVMRWDGETLMVHADLGQIATWHANDMVVAPDGTAYVGNFGWDLYGEWTEVVPATLALVRPDGSVEAAAQDMLFPNGSIITPTGTTLLVAESMASQITSFRIGAEGRLSDRTVFAPVPGTNPDGACLDAEGAVWFADAIGRRVVRVLQGGEITQEVAVERNTYACALGGPDRRTLFILSAEGHTPAENRGAGTGRIEITTVDVPGAGVP